MEKKVITKFAFKSQTTSNYPAKTVCWVYNTGVTVIRTMVLADKDTFISDFAKVYSRFGKALYIREISLKYSSLNFIQTLATKALLNNNINPKDLL